MKDHFMIGQRVFLECTDGRSRWLTIDDVQTADQIFAASESLSDAEAHGLWLWGTDGSGVRRLANVPWTRAVYVKARNDINGNPRRGWKILNAKGRMIEFVDEGYHGTLSYASHGKYPQALGDSAERQEVTAEAYGTLKETAGNR